MATLSRRAFVAASLASVATGAARAQAPGHEGHAGLYESLRQPGRIGKPEEAAAQNVFDSPVPKATEQGRWMPKAPLPIPPQRDGSGG